MGHRYTLQLIAAMFAAQYQITVAQTSDTQLAAIACNEEFVLADESYPFLRQTPLTEQANTRLTIESLEFTRLRIFDEANPDENNALYRWANRIHFLTRQSTVEQLMLFSEGQQIEGRLLDETARILRNQNYFYDADLRLVSNCNQQVKVEVITKDTWSLTPSLSFDRSGGENTFSVGIRDSNLLGLGKEVAIERSEDIDRESDAVTYEDPNVLGTWIRNRTVFMDSDDGSEKRFELGLPFYALDSRRSWALLLQDETRRDAQWLLGKEISEVEHDIEIGEFSYGWSQGLIDGSYSRLSAGVRYQRDRFAPSPDFAPPLEMPGDRELVYPFFQFEYGENRFATSSNFDELLRTEDLYLGQSLVARIGYASTGFGSDQNRVVIEGNYGGTLKYDQRHFWQHNLNWQALFNTDRSRSEDVLLNYSTRYFFRHSQRWSFFASLNGSYSNNLSNEREIYMGGSRGTRAFDNRLQTGDRSVVLSLEERVYTDWHLLNLIRVGGAIFFDVGRAWEPGADSGLPDSWLANVGLGLRLMSSKAASSRIAHLDFAFPITNRGHSAVDNVQVAFNIKGRF